VNVVSHVPAVRTHSGYAESNVFCCSVTDRLDLSFILFLCVADVCSGDGYVATALTDAEYPRRAALSMCTSILQEFGIKFPNARAPVAWPQLEQHLARCSCFLQLALRQFLPI